MGSIGDFLLMYSNKSGYVHTEFGVVRDALIKSGAELVDTIKVKLVDDESTFMHTPNNRRTFYKLKVEDLAQAYRVMWFTTLYVPNGAWD
jgi:hypothetical protein